MYGITQIVFCSLVVCVIRVSTERDDSDLNLSQVFRTPKDFSRVNFDHLEILERNNFDQPQPSHQPEPENNGEPQLTHHPKSVANAQVMLRFGGDDIRGKNVIECPEKCGRSPTRINPNHNHHIMNNEMRYPNYPPYSQPQFLPPVPPPSPYNYAYSAPPPPYYFPGPYYPSRMPTYELPNGQLVPANGPNFSEERPISVDNFLEYRKKEENLANINRPKIILTEEMSNDTIPEVNCTDWRRNPSKKDQNDEYTETSDGNYIKVPSAGRYISLSTNPKEFPILTSPVFPESENKPEKSSVLQPNVEGLKGYILPQSLQKEYVFLPQPGKESGIWLTPTRKEYQVGTEKEKPFNSPQDVEEIRRNISPPSSSEKVYASRPQSEKESVIWMIPTREEINNHQVHAQQEISCGFPQDMKNVKGNISPLLPKEIGSYQVPAEQETSCDFAQDKKDMNGNISPPLPEKADVSLPPTNPKAFSILMSPGSPVCGNEVRTEPEKYFVISQNVEELKDISPQPLKQEYVSLPQTENKPAICLTPTQKESAEYKIGTEQEKPFDSPQDVKEIKKNISSPSSSEKVYASRPQSEKESTIWKIPTREEINNHQVCAQQEIPFGSPQDMKNVKGNISPSLPREIGSYQVPAEQETSCNFPQDKKEMNGYISPPLPEKADVSLRPTNPKAFPILISHVSPVSENEVGTEPEKYFVIPQNVEELKDISSQPPKQQYVFLPQTEKESEQKPLDFPQDVEKIRKNISSPSSSEKVYASRPQSEEESTIWMIPTREGIINHQVHAQQESQRVIGFPQDIKNVEGNISPLLPKEIGNYQVPAKQETSFGLPQDKKDIHGNISPPLPGKANVPLPPTYPEKCPILMSSVSSVSPVSENKVGTEPEKSSVIPQNVAESKDISPQSPKQEYVSLLQTEKKSCIWLTPTRKESAEYQEQENPYDFPQNVKEISKNISPPTSSEKVYASRSQSGVENVIWIIPTREEIDNHQVCAQQEIPLGSPHVIDKVKGNISPPLPEKACVPLPEPEKESSVWLTSTRRKSNVHQVPNEEGKPFVKDIRENISHPSSEKVYASRPQSEKESAVWFIPVRKEIDNYQVPAEQETSIGIPQDIKVSNGIISPQLPVETYVSLPQPEIESSVWLTPTRKESDNHQVQTEHEKPPNFPQNIEVTKGNILPPSPEGVYVSRPQLEKETVVWLTRQEEPIDLLQVDENLKKPEPSSPNPTTKEFLDYLSTISTKYENQNSQGRNGEPIDLTEVTEVMRKFIESIPMKKKESLPPDVRYISTTPLENVERECDNSPPETRKEKPISIPPVIIIESTQQILEEVANSEHPKESPIYPPNISKESPIPLPPVIDNSSTTSLLHSKEAPISLPPVLEETATNQEKLIPLPSIPHKPITYYPKCTDVPYSEAHPERQFIEFEGRLNKSLVPYDCPCTTCREKPRLLLSYPIHQEQHLPNEEKRVNIIGCPCCQSKGYCDCCQRKGCCNCRRDPHVPFGKRFPTDVDALQQVATPYFNNRETHILPKQESPKQDYNGAIPQTHSTGYSSSMTSGYSSEFSQNGNHKPKVNIEGYRSSSGSGYYSDPSNDVFYQGPSVVDVVRTPDPHEPVLEHTRIEQPNRYKIVQKYEMVPKVVKPLIITELVPTNVFVCEQSDGAHPARTVCHREYAPVERRQGEQAPEDIVRRPAEEHVCGGDMRRNYISRNYFLDNAVGDIRRAPVTRDNCFIRPLEEDIKPVNFNVLRGLRQDVPVAVTPQITREINPIEVLNIASVKGVIEMVPTSHFIPCRRRPRQTANGTEATEN